MAISVLAIHRNQNIPPSLAIGGTSILSGVIECVFKGVSTQEVTRDTLSFSVGRVNLGSGDLPIASCIMSPVSFAYDGAVNSALWAVDSANITSYTNVDRGSGTADLEITANLAVRAPSGIILRVNYAVFYFPG